MGGVPAVVQFFFKYKAGKVNVVADALSRKHMLLSMVDSKILGFELIKEYYEQDPDFRVTFKMCQNESFGHYNIVDGFFLKLTNCVFLSVLPGNY